MGSILNNNNASYYATLLTPIEKELYIVTTWIIQFTEQKNDNKKICTAF
jgi:hypothetical protein